MEDFPNPSHKQAKYEHELLQHRHDELLALLKSDDFYEGDDEQSFLSRAKVRREYEQVCKELRAATKDSPPPVPAKDPEDSVPASNIGRGLKKVAARIYGDQVLFLITATIVLGTLYWVGFQAFQALSVHP